MKKLLLILSIYFAVISTVNAQFWTRKNTGFTAASRGIREISWADQNNVWLHPYDGGGTATPILEYARSSDGGNTWVNGTMNGLQFTPPLTTTTISSFKGISGTVAYVGTADFGLSKTIDGGATWTLQTSGLFTGPDSFFNFGIFVDENIGIVGGDPDGGYMEIYRTTNGGANWTRIPSSSIAPILPGEYFFTNSYSQSGNAMYFFTNKSRTYRSLDAGLTWTAHQNPFSATNETPGGELCLKNELEGIYFTSEYAYWKTTDGGVTYQDLFAEGTLRCFGLSFIPGTTDTYVSVGSDLDNDVRGTSISCDGGLTWTDIATFGDPVNPQGPLAISFFNVTSGLVGDFNTNSTIGGIFKYEGPAMGDQLSACPAPLSNAQFSSDKLFTLSPNPTSGKMTLSGANINQVQVIDILGKVVYNNSYSSIAEVTIDLSNVNSGIYLVKVTNDLGNTSVLKAIKE